MKLIKKCFLYLSLVAAVGSFLVYFYLKWIGKSVDEKSYSDELYKDMDCLREVNANKRKAAKRVDMDEARKKSLRNISYDLKNSIGITKGYAEGLKYNIARSEVKKKQYYDILVEEANRMEKLVAKILEVLSF